jgi:hypothetical protein
MILAYYRLIKEYDQDDLTYNCSRMAAEESKRTNKIIEFDIGGRIGTYFPCGCKVEFMPAATYNKVISWPCTVHNRHLLTKKVWNTPIG